MCPLQNNNKILAVDSISIFFISLPKTTGKTETFITQKVYNYPLAFIEGRSAVCCISNLIVFHLWSILPVNKRGQFCIADNIVLFSFLELAFNTCSEVCDILRSDMYLLLSLVTRSHCSNHLIIITLKYNRREITDEFFVCVLHSSNVLAIMHLIEQRVS